MKNLLFIACLLSLVSCEDLFIKDLELEELGFEKQLVVQAELGSKDDFLAVFVSENASVLDLSNDVKIIDDADLRLVFEGEEVTDFTIGEDRRYYHFFSDSMRTPGKYQLMVDNPEYGEVVGETEIPEDVIIKDLTIKADVGYDALEMSTTHEVSFTFTDLPGRNYYSFELFGESTLDTFIQANGDTSFYESEPAIYGTTITDPSLSSGLNGGGIYIDDSFFDGKEYMVKFRFVVYNISSSQESLEENLKFKWNVHSEDSYFYNVSLQNYFSSGDFGPFSEPVSVHTNIEGGLGIFAGINTKTFSF
jgi:hypothetical protein